MPCYRRLMEHQAQGWYRDPWAIHEDRYFSGGTPTKLVRDGSRESYDEPPPGESPPEAGLVSAERLPDEANGGSDLRRADGAADDPPYEAGKARRAVLDVFDRTSGQW
jgi:hypothetical protein